MIDNNNFDDKHIINNKFIYRMSVFRIARDSEITKQTEIVSKHIKDDSTRSNDRSMKIKRIKKNKVELF